MKTQIDILAFMGEMKAPFQWSLGWLMVLLYACSLHEDPPGMHSSNGLIFSSDTITFDTLLTARTSITKRLRIRNPNEKEVIINSIALAAGQGSPYHIIVNGKTGHEAQNELLAAGDSILVLVTVEINPQDNELPYLIKDSIIVGWQDQQHNIKLRAWGQDAHFLDKGTLCDTTWTAGKPYVLLDTLVVEKDCRLNISAGTQVLFEPGAALFIAGQMQAVGDSGMQIVFRNTRFDENYLEAPGQWDAIYFLEGSSGNVLDHVIVENGRVGLRIGTPDADTLPDVTVDHTIIRHMSQSGVQAFSSDLTMTNSLIYNTGEQSVLNVAGGNYHYVHCTFVNTPSFFISNDPIVIFADNLILGNDEVLAERLSVQIVNSVIWGGADDELLISQTLEDNHLDLRNNLIKSAQQIPSNFMLEDTDAPGFLSSINFDYRPDSASFLLDKGLRGFVMDDLQGIPRDSLPDLGAYEFSMN